MTDIGGFTPAQAQEVWNTTKLLRSSGLLRNLSNIPLPDDPGLSQVHIKNDSGEEIPAFACLEILGTEVIDNRTFLKVTKPTRTNAKYIFNHDRKVVIDGLGIALAWGVVRMLGEPPDEPKQYGPTIGQWTVEENSSGPFVVYGQDAYSEDVVKGRITGSGGGAQVIQFSLVGQEDEPYDYEYGGDELCENRDNALPPYYGEVRRTACGASRPVFGEDYEGIVELADDLGLLANRDRKQLSGKIGIAALIKDTEDEYGECYWCIVYIDFHREIQIITDIVFQDNKIVIERKLVKVWDDCVLPDEEIEGIDCVEDDDEYYYTGEGI
jgi:hypothetical protein